MEKLKHEEIVEKCVGCLKIVLSEQDSTISICSVYIFPSSKWRFQNCPLCTHIKKKVTEEEKMDPLKKSKRGFKKKK